jgi:hypothetical protein
LMKMFWLDSTNDLGRRNTHKRAKSV